VSAHALHLLEDAGQVVEDPVAGRVLYGQVTDAAGV
jgi:hypothetical protein